MINKWNKKYKFLRHITNLVYPGGKLSTWTTVYPDEPPLSDECVSFYAPMRPRRMMHCQPECTKYTVQRGDTLCKIGLHFGIPVHRLMEYNSLTHPDCLRPGEQILIPPHEGCSGPYSYSPCHENLYHVPYPATLRGIAGFLQIPLECLTYYNPKLKPDSLITPGRVLRLPPGPETCCEPLPPCPSVCPTSSSPQCHCPPADAMETVHVVRKGETMGKISQRYGIPVKSLIEYNKQVDNPEQLRLGDKIRIPPRGFCDLPPCPPDGTQYTVPYRTTLRGIAGYFKIPLEYLQYYNPEFGPDELIKHGKVISLPPEE